MKPSDIPRLLAFGRAVWRYRRHQTSLPRLLTYLVTFTCNARCIMCDSWKKSSSDDLTLPEIRTIFQQLRQMDIVRISGGEPFLRKNLLDIAHLAQDLLRPLLVHVTTNGFLTKRIVDFCEQRDPQIPLYLLVSVDGMREKHNQVRGVETAWERAFQTLTALAPRQKQLHLTLAVNQTIVDAEGLEHYSRLREMLRPLGIQHHVVLAYDVSATYHRDPQANVAPTELGQFTTFGTLRRDQIAALLDVIKRDLPNALFLNRLAKAYYLLGIRHRLLEHRAYPNPPCVALQSHLRLLPDGTIPICQFNTTPVGNLRTQRFDEIWFSPAIQAHREWVRRCPGCWAECEVLPNALYTGDVLLKTLARWLGGYAF
ncbi:radical SAM protein [candidate division KSB3 bacterium]|uniref:Radical SAM protein n=1 Tax=candidate division KSB3 bacterium TaxID=2044937 RepID=A0A9D5Q811_9BACT|nr:radical SAM protein [candidate division KSB3 bacterium]MBD3327449.1 radical SAM protein [candidate division KSB3 bacterium]